MKCCRIWFSGAYATQHAFTMIELVVAIAVIAMGLLPLLWMLTLSHETTRETIEEFIGTNCAAEVIEGVQTLSYDVLEEMEDIRLDDLGAVPERVKKFDLRIPKMPKEFKIYLSLKKISLRDDLPDCRNLPDERFSKSVKERAGAAAQPFLIEVRVEWKDGGSNDCIRLTTMKGCY